MNPDHFSCVTLDQLLNGNPGYMSSTPLVEDYSPNGELQIDLGDSQNEDVVKNKV